MAKAFTDAYLRGLRPAAQPYKVSDAGEKGEGRLVVRIRPTGAKDFFYRYRLGDADRLIALGSFDPTGKDGLTLQQARDKRKAKTKVRKEYGDVKAHAAVEAQKKDAEERRGSLGDLCNAYVASLKAAGKVSARSVELALRMHVEKAHRGLWRIHAANVTADQIRDVLAKMVEAGCTRQVNIVRAHLSAAYKWGAKADHDPRSVAAKGKRYGLQANPVALVPIVAEWEPAPPLLPPTPCAHNPMLVRVQTLQRSPPRAPSAAGCTGKSRMPSWSLLSSFPSRGPLARAMCSARDREAVNTSCRRTPRARFLTDDGVQA